MSTARVHHFPKGLIIEYKDDGVPFLAAQRASKLQPILCAKPGRQEQLGNEGNGEFQQQFCDIYDPDSYICSLSVNSDVV